MSPSYRRATTTRFRAGPAAAVAASAAVLTFGLAPVAHAAPGDNGDVKVHNSSTATDDQRDEPKVCTFYLDAFNFDVLQQVSFTIDQQPPTGRKEVLSGTITLANGNGRTQDFTLPNGHYKLNWTFEGEKGSAKHKVFMVDCPPGKGGNVGGGAGSTPLGGVGTGGGGSVHGPDIAEIAAGSALTAAAAGFGLRALRRRRSAVRHATA